MLQGKSNAECERQIQPPCRWAGVIHLGLQGGKTTVHWILISLPQGEAVYTLWTELFSWTHNAICRFSAVGSKEKLSSLSLPHPGRQMQEYSGFQNVFWRAPGMGREVPGRTGEERNPGLGKSSLLFYCLIILQRSTEMLFTVHL